MGCGSLRLILAREPLMVWGELRVDTKLGATVSDLLFSRRLTLRRFETC